MVGCIGRLGADPVDEPECGPLVGRGCEVTASFLERLRNFQHEITRESVRDELAATKDFKGVTGGTTFDPETREPVKSLARMQVKDGSFALVQ